MRSFILSFIVLLVPQFVQAAVVINEVAWMGTVDSANDEWIELYNTGSSVSLDGWVLTDGMNLEIELTGTIHAGEYAVLERTDDTTAPGSAFLIYTGALSNTGATLKLLRDGGGIEDQVAGGEDWENIGGDNVTKETAQLTSSGWVTGTPTPGRANVAYEPPVKEDDEKIEDDEDRENADDEERVVGADSVSKEKMALLLPKWKLDLALTAPDYAYVHQPVTFTLEPSGIPDALLNSVGANWNMGDLSLLRGQEVVHQYEYPGKYVVVVTGTFKEHEATFRHEITVLPVTFSITKNSNGDLQINNDSKYEVDLSGYSMRGAKTVIIPEDTILLPNATLTIPKERLGGEAYAWLMDQEHAVVASTVKTAPEKARAVVKGSLNEIASVVTQKPEAFVSPSRTTESPQVIAAPKANFTFADAAAIEEEQTETIQETIVEAPAQIEERLSNEATVNQAQVPIPSENLPYYGLAGILSLGILALYATRVR